MANDILTLRQAGIIAAPPGWRLAANIDGRSATAPVAAFEFDGAGGYSVWFLAGGCLVNSATIADLEYRLEPPEAPRPLRYDLEEVMR